MIESTGWNYNHSSQFKIELIQSPQSLALNTPKSQRITPILSLTQLRKDDDDDDENEEVKEENVFLAERSVPSFLIPDITFKCFCIASLIPITEEYENLKGKGQQRADPILVEGSFNSSKKSEQENFSLLQGDTISSLYHFIKRSCFVFPELQILKVGEFKLKFSLYEILKGKTHLITSIFSEEFKVFEEEIVDGGEEIVASSSFPSQALRAQIRKGSQIHSQSTPLMERKIVPPFAPLIPSRPYQSYPPTSPIYLQSQRINLPVINRKRSLVDITGLNVSESTTPNLVDPSSSAFSRSFGNSIEVSRSPLSYQEDYAASRLPSSYRYTSNSIPQPQPRIIVPYDPHPPPTFPLTAYPFPSIIPNSQTPLISSLNSSPQYLFPRPPPFQTSISSPLPLTLPRQFFHSESPPFLTTTRLTKPHSYPISIISKSQFELDEIEILRRVGVVPTMESRGEGGGEGGEGGGEGGVNLESIESECKRTKIAESAVREIPPEVVLEGVGSDEKQEGKGNLNFLLGENVDSLKGTREEELGEFFFCE